MSRPRVSHHQPAPSPVEEPPAAPPRPRPPRPGGRLAGALLEALPLLVPALFAGFSLVAMALLQLGLFRPLLVLPLGLAGALVAARAVAVADPEPLAGPRWLDGAALLVVLAFAGLNARYSAQNIDVFRDPAVYAITGQWLEHHGSLSIPVHPEVFGAVKGISFFSQGFDAGTTKGFVHPQFGNLLPGLLAVGGWIGGDQLLLKMNPLIGSAALLAFYGLARQYAGRAWALVAVVALGVSIPQLAFSRNAYSEPVTMLFLVGGLALLREAQRRERIWAYGLAGLALGSAVLARVDGFLFLLAVPMFAAAALAVAPAGRRRDAAAKVGAFVLGVAVPAAVAMANLANLSPAYLRDRSGELGMIAKAGVAVTVLGALAVLLAWGTRLPQRIAAATARWLPAAGAAAVVLLAAVAASRPLWYVARQGDAPQQTTGYIAFLQKAEGLAIDGTRTYAEQTLEWFSWYWGPIALGLGVLGIAYGVYWLLKRGDLRLVAPLGMFLCAALLYLARPSIVPDQVWAMRRYLPVIIPGLLLGAAVTLRLLARRGRALSLVAALLAAAMVLFPTYVSARLITVREGVPQLVEAHNLCDNLPADAALLLTGSLAKTYQQTARSYCDDAPVAGLSVQPTRALLGQVQAAAASHGRRLYIVVTSRDALPPDLTAASTPWQAISCVRVSHWNAVLEQAARAWGADPRTLYLGTVTPQGTVTPATPTKPPISAC
jgi:Dolichyl-phosphate-mannose-protein mannosyltransferase